LAFPRMEQQNHIPSGSLLHSYWKWSFSSLISPWKMVIFHSELVKSIPTAQGATGGAEPPRKYKMFIDSPVVVDFPLGNHLQKIRI
jgi:hypothetical protein